jgi:hypothetical protein
MMRTAGIAFLLAWLFAIRPGGARADGGDSTSFAASLREGFHYRIEALAFGTLLDLKQSRFNPNNIFGFPRYQAEIDARPDFDLELDRVRLAVKPRLELRRRWFEEGSRAGTAQNIDSSYVHEWQARLRVAGGLYLSYGRENLQWGPSYLISPSNPFHRGNGQNNPRLEEPGLDYARAVWIPGYRWALSLIANTGEGRLTTNRPFERRYAVKTDYTGHGRYATLILSQREDGGRLRAGAFAGWSASDALLLHAEGDVEGGIDQGKILTGAAYTFPPGSFAVVEYFHDGTGCRYPKIWQCYNPFEGGSDVSEVLVRRDYLMLQFTHPRLREDIHVSVRWIHNMDDASDRLIGIYEHDIDDRFQLFAVGGIDRGRDRDEFGSVASGAAMAGVRWVH